MSITGLGQAEYEALRATIRQRGTARLWVVILGVAAWGWLALSSATAGRPNAALLVPFIVLAATFEINFFIHTGVERIGRYVQVFFEEQGGSIGWETTAMNYGATFPGRGLDPLFSVIFFSAAMVNFFVTLAVANHQVVWIGVSLVAHLAFNYRIVRARRISAQQRSIELEQFRNLASAK
jgi:hypothetical protein